MTKTKLQQKPESIINDEPRTFDDASFPIGSVAAQGDLYFIRIGKMPRGSEVRVNRQLAEGNTQGSRHIVETGDVFDCQPEEVLKAIQSVCKGTTDLQSRYIGPVFRTVEGLADVVHPEHGDHFFRGEMILATVFQRSLDAELREQRTRD